MDLASGCIKRLPIDVEMRGNVNKQKSLRKTKQALQVYNDLLKVQYGDVTCSFVYY